jgi:PleD family two-component response regulator
LRPLRDLAKSGPGERINDLHGNPRSPGQQLVWFKGVPMGTARILLIEDEATSREILQYVLSEAGYTVDAATTAAAAHKQLDLISYGLVIADWQLPDGDGTASISPTVPSLWAPGP